MNSDWLQQVSRIERSYDTIFQNDANAHSNANGSGNASNNGLGGLMLDLHADTALEEEKTYHGANRFPPRARPQQISGIDNERYNMLASDAVQESHEIADRTGRHVQNAELLAKLESILILVRSNREQGRTRCSYLASLPLTCTDSESTYLSEVLMELRSFYEEAVELVRDIDTLQFTAPAAVGSGTGTSDHTNKSESESEPEPEPPAAPSLPHAAGEYCQAMRVDASATAVFLTTLIDQAEDMLYAPRGEVCKLDGVQPDWRCLDYLQQKLVSIPVAARALRYVNATKSQNIPVCPPLYNFLCNPEYHIGILCISEHRFHKQELSLILSFLANDTGVRADGTSTATAHTIKELLLVNCMLCDRDVYEVSAFLIDFPALHTLSLRGNNMTSAGLTNLSTVIWEHGLPLRVLQLDQNRIGHEGAMMLAKSMHRCRFLQRLSISFNPIGDIGAYYLLRATMNPHRKARRSLPRPPELLSLEGDEGNIDFHSDEESSDGEESEKESESEDDDDDAFTAVGDNESVYSTKVSYVPSVTMSRRGLAAAENIRQGKEALKHQHLTNLQRFYKRIRIKVAAVAFFTRVQPRGHNLHTIEMAGCGCGPFTIRMVSHCVCDNHNLATIVLSENALGSSEYEDVDNSALLALVTDSRVEHLILRSCGLYEYNVEAMVRGLNSHQVTSNNNNNSMSSSNSKSVHSYLRSVDLSGNHLGPTGANLIASLPGYFMDQVSIGLGYKPHTLLSSSSFGNKREANNSRNDRSRRVGAGHQGGERVGPKDTHIVMGHHKGKSVQYDTSASSPSLVRSNSNSSARPVQLQGGGGETFDDDNDFEGEDMQMLDARLLEQEHREHVEGGTVEESKTPSSSS